MSGSVSLSIFMLRVGWPMSSVVQPKLGYVDINICGYNEKMGDSRLRLNRDELKLNKGQRRAWREFEMRDKICLPYAFDRELHEAYNFGFERDPGFGLRNEASRRSFSTISIAGEVRSRSVEEHKSRSSA